MVTRKNFLRIFVFIFQVREKKREREGRAEIGKKDKARRNERKGRESPDYSFFFFESVHQLYSTV